VVGETAAVANARLLRAKYGDDLPVGVRGSFEQPVRKGMGWSKVRAEKAIEAYRAGADLPQQASREQATESTSATEDRADEDGQPAAATA
jgi:hypothetical protein